jgi:hypothetical protein
MGVRVIRCLVLLYGARLGTAQGPCSGSMGVVYKGSNLATKSVGSAEDCCNLCNSNPKCAFFSFDLFASPPTVRDTSNQFRVT